MAEILIIFLIVGVIVGILAGLLGIGGGIILVPTLVYILPKIGLETNLVMQVALGTSVACTFFSMLSSAFGHYKNGSIKFYIYLKLVVGLFIGSILGPIIAHNLNYNALKNIFAVLLFIVSLRMLLENKIKKTDKNSTIADYISYNNIYFLSISGIIVGTLASLMGIGGGVLLLPLFTFMNIKMKDAVGTSAISGVTISTIALIGYIISGYYSLSQSELYLGYVYLPAVIGISITSIIFAQVSARWSTKVPHELLKKILSCILIFTAGKMFW